MRNIFTAVRLALPHLREDFGRAGYLTITLAVAVAVWLGLSALASPFVHADVPFAGKVVVLNPRHGNTLPTRYAGRIAEIPGAGDVSYLNFSPVICRSPATAATLNGVGGPGTHQRLAEVGVDAAMEKAWNADPIGVLVGVALAADCGWKVGMSVDPPDVSGNPVEIHIVGVFKSAQPYNNQVAYAHYEYINRLPGLMGTRDHVNSMNVYSRTSSKNALLAARIDATFAHDDPPVEARTSAAADNAMARFGHVQNLLAWVMAAIFTCTTLVLVSVLAHAAAQRRTAIAVLQVLGFRRGLLFFSFLIECVVIVVAATALGLGVGHMAISLLRPTLAPVLGQFAAPSWAYSYLPLWLSALLLVSLLLPALIVARTRPTDYPAT